MLSPDDGFYFHSQSNEGRYSYWMFLPITMDSRARVPHRGVDCIRPALTGLVFNVVSNPCTEGGRNSSMPWSSPHGQRFASATILANVPKQPGV